MRLLVSGMLPTKGRRARGHASHATASMTHDEGESSSSSSSSLPAAPWQVQLIEGGQFTSRQLTRAPYNEYPHLDQSQMVLAPFVEDWIAYGASLTKEIQRMSLDIHNASLTTQSRTQPSQERPDSQRDNEASGSRGTRKLSRRR